MSSTLVIRIIGGVCGGAIGSYISAKIYDYVYNKPQIQLSPLKKYNCKFKDAKSFEEIYKIQLKEQIDNADKYNYEYDNEHGNNVEITEKNNRFINDNDDYTFLTALGRDNN
jgi:hypothetical protein